MVEETPAVTVIIPTYNCSGALKLTLETVLAQDFKDFEVWVVGDGCTDDSEEVVSSFGDERLNWINLPINSGTPTKPRNEALRRAKGRLIAYLGHDDLWFPWHLSELVDCVDETGSDFVYSVGAFVEPEGIVNTFSLPDKPWGRNTHLSPSNWVHRRDMLQSVGLWPEDIEYGDDREFLRRVFAANIKLGFRRQFSVLKFPAAVWRMYARTLDYPQASYVESMRKDPERLGLELLMSYTADMSMLGVWLRRSSTTRSKRLLIWLIGIYGHHRWPLSYLLYRRYRWKSGLSKKPSFFSRIFDLLS
jgi:glycosyltransferase involved in cell wall biosynthesis